MAGDYQTWVNGVARGIVFAARDEEWADLNERFMASEDVDDWDTAEGLLTQMAAVFERNLEYGLSRVAAKDREAVGVAVTELMMATVGIG